MEVEHALKKAIMVEKEAMKRYMEDAHYQILEAELDGIKGTGFWLGIPEFTMD